MTDYNQQSTEVDMGTVERVFRYASDTIVEASRLRGEFMALSAEVNALREDLAKLRRHNEFLDEQLTHVRQQRDDSHRKVQELEQVLHERNQENAKLTRRLDEASTTNHHLQDQLSLAQHDRDDAQLRVMELEEENGKLKERFAAIQEKLTALQDVFAPVNPTVQATVLDPSARQPGESEAEHRERTQPRDPVTQQWRSPYSEMQQEEVKQAAKSDEYIPF